MDILKLDGVTTTITDQCMFGLKTWGPDGSPTSAKKKTRFMSNAEEILLAISTKCDGAHAHQQLVNGRAGPAAIYPPALCQAICKGLVKQLHLRRSNLKSLLSLKKGDKVWAAPDQEENLAEMEKAWDDVSGKELDSRGVREARAKEMTYIHDKQVWVKMSKQDAIARGCKVVGSRWVDVDKGDTSKPDYRSRLVAKEINTGPEEGLFASTPPLEAMRWLLSEAATVEPTTRGQ